MCAKWFLFFTFFFLRLHSLQLRPACRDFPIFFLPKGHNSEQAFNHAHDNPLVLLRPLYFPTVHLHPALLLLLLLLLPPIPPYKIYKMTVLLQMISMIYVEYLLKIVSSGTSSRSESFAAMVSVTINYQRLELFRHTSPMIQGWLVFFCTSSGSHLRKSKTDHNRFCTRLHCATASVECFGSQTKQRSWQ